MNSNKNFTFTKKNGVFGWSNNDIRIEFSNPRIQSHDEYSYAKDEKDIMYYYYTVKISKRVFTDFDEETNESIHKWKTVVKRSAYDFPTITQFKWILHHMLFEVDPTTDGQKHTYSSGRYEYSSTFCTEGFICDDFYEITKFVDASNKNTHYILYLGCTFDVQGDLNSCGIRTPYVKEEDVKELLKCVDGFIQFSIDKHNASVKEYIKEETSNKEIKNNKMYKYRDGKLESIYVVGDFGDFTVLKDREKVMHSVHYCKVKITKFEDNSILLSNGEKVDIQDVMFFFDEVDKAKLAYGVEEIARDFLSILNAEEIEEFKTYKVETLLSKYRSAIIDRTSMCRDEHGFDDVKSAVVKVIETIKCELLKN